MKLNANHEIASEAYSKITDGIFSVLLGLSFKQYVYLLSPLSFSFKLMMLFFSYFVVIYSRVGYHKSIKKQPYKKARRFLVDLWICYMYYILVFSPGLQGTEFNFKLLLGSGFGIFLGYFSWDLLKAQEYEYDLTVRQGITGLCLLLSYILYIGYGDPLLLNNNQFLDATIHEGIFLFVEFFMFIVFWGSKYVFKQ